MGRYMNKGKLDIAANGGPITVRGFEGLSFWVVPDPKDTRLVAEQQERYNSGWSISFKEWKITEAQYADSSFWNS